MYDDKRRVSLFFFILIMIFFYVPILMLVALSFNESRSNEWTGFSLRWYKELFFNSPKLWITFYRSIIIALSSSIIAVIIATLGSIGLKWYSFKFKNFVKLMTYIPLILPDLIIGVSLLIFFNISKNLFPLGMLTVFIAHTTFNIPFSIFVIMSRLDEFDFSIVEAARDLGATEFQTLTKVIIPTMMPGIISAFLMSLTLSLDDYVITSFVTGVSSDTLPIQIYSMLKFGITPAINALSTILILGTLILSISSRKIQKYMIK